MSKYQNQNTEQETLFEEKIDGTWVSINIDGNTYYFLHSIKTRLQELNIRVSRNDILKRLLLLGTENLSFDALIKNPLALWSSELEEELI